MLLPYQEYNLNKINDATQNNRQLTIIGTKCSGRRYVIKEWLKQQKNALIFYIKQEKSNDEYASLVSALKNRISSKSKLTRFTFAPNIAFSIKKFGFGFTLETNSIIKRKNDLEYYLKRLSRRHTLIFIIDDDLSINDESVELIENFLMSKKNVYEFILSEETKKTEQNIYFENLSSYNDCDKSAILKGLNLNPSIQLSNNVIEFIFTNIANNIGLLINIINNLNENNLDSCFEKYDTNSTIKNLLDESMRKYPYSEQIQDLLRICAITERCFQTIDFAFLLKQNESAIKELLNFAQEHYLIDGNSEGYQILFGLVKKIYNNIDNISKNKIYANIICMFANIYPSDYYNKYVFANMVNDKSKNVYLVQHIFKMIRMNHNIDLDLYSNMLNEEEYRIVEIYNKAFGFISAREYTECINLLKTLNNLNTVLRYEINILLSQCLIKEISVTSRKNALDYLDCDNSSKSLDENLKFRLNIRKIAALIHVGEYTKAVACCDNVKSQLIDLYSETHALEYQYYLNVIFRKFSYVCDYDLSINEVKSSVIFFRKHKKDYYKGLYIALNNLFSLYIINMQLDKAAEIREEIINLKLEKNSINFPRSEIFENNEIIYHFFKKDKCSDAVLENCKKLYDKMFETADHILIASNYAVLLMFCDKLCSAENILAREIANIENDKEGVYSYRIIINLAICRFLMDNTKKEESLNILQSVKYNEQDPHYNTRNEELQNIIKLMNNTDECNDVNIWCKKFKQQFTTVMSTYTTYQQGVVFTTLFDWDDD